MNKAAQELGRLGGRAGRGKAKARTSERPVNPEDLFAGPPPDKPYTIVVRERGQKVIFERRTHRAPFELPHQVGLLDWFLWLLIGLAFLHALLGGAQ